MSDQQAEALRLSEQKRRAAQQEYADKQKAKQEADKARSDALMAQRAEDLRFQNQQRQAALQEAADRRKAEPEERNTAQQEVRDKLNQRIQQAYQGWSKVPAGLCTRAQLAREGLHLPEGVEPVAEVFGYRPKQRGHVIYKLYRREDAVPHASQRGDHGFAAGRNRKSE